MSSNSRFTIAVHLLTMMAWSDRESLKSEQIARSVNTHPVVIRRMLCELAESNLISSQTGAAGGSRLARKPEQITLLDVYRTVESAAVFSLHRQRPNPRCPIGANIAAVLADVRGDLDSAIEQVLGRITIEDIMFLVKKQVGKSVPRIRRPKGPKLERARTGVN
jgi:Rrf2 family protein